MGDSEHGETLPETDAPLPSVTRNCALVWEVIRNDKQTRQQMRDFETHVNGKFAVLNQKLDLLLEAQGIPPVDGALTQPWA